MRTHRARLAVCDSDRSSSSDPSDSDDDFIVSSEDERCFGLLMRNPHEDLEAPGEDEEPEASDEDTSDGDEPDLVNLSEDDGVAEAEVTAAAEADDEAEEEMLDHLPVDAFEQRAMRDAELLQWDTEHALLRRADDLRTRDAATNRDKIWSLLYTIELIPIASVKRACGQVYRSSADEFLSTMGSRLADVLTVTMLTRYSRPTADTWTRVQSNLDAFFSVAYDVYADARRRVVRRHDGVDAACDVALRRSSRQHGHYLHASTDEVHRVLEADSAASAPRRRPRKRARASSATDDEM